MIDVYVFGSAPRPVWNVTRDLRVLWALEETGLAYRVRPLDFARGELKTPEYLRIHPFGKIPAIVDEGFALFESAAIVLYLAEKAGKLLPPSLGLRGRALAAQWVFAAVNTVEPPIQELFVIDHFAANESWAKEHRPAVQTQVEARLATLDGELARRPYLMGDEFGAPDILMTTVLRMLQHTGLLRAAPNVAAYQARCEARPAWRKVVAEHLQRLAA
ncbi:MAG TPA: glutathione S-transferase family protein [Myxococcota bacterium]|jgi:glutathione S-transferase